MKVLKILLKIDLLMLLLTIATWLAMYTFQGYVLPYTFAMLLLLVIIFTVVGVVGWVWVTLIESIRRGANK